MQICPFITMTIGVDRLGGRVEVNGSGHIELGT